MNSSKKIGWIGGLVWISSKLSQNGCPPSQVPAVQPASPKQSLMLSYISFIFFLLLFTLLFLLLSILLDIISESKNFNNKTYCRILELLLRSTCMGVYRDSIFIQIFTHKILMRADLILRVCFLFFTFSDRCLPSPLSDLKGTKSWKTLYR